MRLFIHKAITLWLFALSFVYLAPSLAQVVNEPSSTKVIESFHVKTDIRFRFATTQMVSVVRNTAEKAQEVAFDVTLPKEAFIVNFSMAIDGKEYVGEVKEKTEAKRQYQTAVDRGQSAGHIRQAPRHSNAFEVSVNVANGSAVTFTLTYQELLRRKLGLYEHEIHVNPGQPVEDFSIEVFIQEKRKIPLVRTPALRTDVLLTNEIEDENELAVVERLSPETAHIKFAPTLVQQGDGGVSARFVVQYDVDHSDKGEVLVADGYFLHFFAPDVPSLPKDIIFVLDVSGSMSGGKIVQLITSMKTILKDLKSEDRFNILTFSNSVSAWKSHLTDVTPSIIQEATNFVNNMRADGGTDINLALLNAVAELRGREDTSRVGMIFFLTDGEPTSGETNKQTIAANILNSNENSAAIFGLAFGSNADYSILKTICGQNLGFARKIYEASDSALQVESLYEEISAVAMKNVKVEYLPTISKTTDTVFPVVFNGTEIVICGFLSRSEKFEAKISGTKRSGDVDVVLNLDNVDEFTIDFDDSLNTFFTMPRDYSGIIEKMWAFLTIKQMLKEKEVVVQDEAKAEKLKNEILAMSLKYNFVTPLTSMVVTKPGDENKEEEKVESGLEDGDELDDPMAMPSHSQSHFLSSARSGLSHGFQHSYMPSGAGGPNLSPSHFYRRRHHSGKKFKNARLFVPSMPPYVAMTHTSHPITFTTTMTTTTTTSSKTTTTGPTTTLGRRKPGKGGKKNRTKKLYPVLSSLTMRSPSSSVCVAPRRLKKGNYTLLEGLNGQLKVELGTDCAKKSCRMVLVDSLNVTLHQDKAAVNLSSTLTWKYLQGQDLTMRLMSQNQLKVSTPTPMLEVVITKMRKGRRLLYDIEIVLQSNDRYGGLLSHLHRKILKRQKAKKAKVPKSCQNKGASISTKLSMKFAMKFMQ